MARRPFFSGNYGSALGSFDTAAKLIAQAGQTQGQAMANIGAQVGGMIEQYGLNKQKREAEERTAVGNLSNFSPQDLLLLEKTNPQLGKAVQNLIDGKGGKKDVDLINAGTAPFIAMKTRDLEGKLKLATTAGLEFKNKLAEQEEKQRRSSIKLVQQEAKELVSNLLGLSGSERQEAFNSLNPLQRKQIREYQLIKQGDIDPSDYMLSAENVLNMEVDMLNIEKLQRELEDQDRERTKAKEDERIKKDRYLALEGQLERIQKGLAEGRLNPENLSVDDSYVLSQEDNIRLGLPLGERPDVVEVLAERKEREAEVAGFRDQQKLRKLGYNVSPRGVFDPTEEGLFRVGTKAESAEPPVASPVTTPPQVFNPVEAKAFRGQFGPQIVDQLDRAYSYFTGKTLPTTDQEEVKRQKQNLATIGNAITPVLLAELGGRVTNLMIERVESNIPLATDNVTVGRQKIGQLVGLAKSQLSRANTYIETLNKGTEAYAEALGVKRFLEANIPALERSIGSLDRAYDLKINDPFLSVDQNVNDSNRTNIDPNRMSNKDLFNIVNQN